MRRYDAVIGTYAKNGARLDLHAREREDAPRTKAGKLDFWTREANRDLDDLDLWAAVESLDRVSRAREESGRDGSTALWSAIVLLCQCRLAETVGMAVKWLDDGMDPAMAYGSWERIGPFRMPGATWERMEARLPPAETETLPGIAGLCLLASPDECRRALRGDAEAVKEVYAKLTARLRASWTPVSGTAGWSSPRSCRRAGRWS